MTQPNRLPKGGRIDRNRRLEFSFNRKRYEGYSGDTLASALLANGISVVGRSFKLHRPRGIVGSGAEEPNAILQLGDGVVTVPNVRATQVELRYGLSAKSVNCWPSVQFDAGSLTGVFSRILPAGFYYKTFMWPKGFWKKYEHFIRRAAGLGVVPSGPDPDLYDKSNVHCDVLVVGGGPAGLAAALAAGRGGARVMLADEQSEFGGSLLARSDLIDQRPVMEWVVDVLAELAAMKHVRLLSRSTVFGYYDHNFLAIVERLTDHLATGSGIGVRERLWRVRAKRVVIAAGAIERPLVFANNDRPGVMLASAVSTYVNRYAVAPGKNVVVFTNNDSAYYTVLDLLRAGVAVAALIDIRPGPGGVLATRVRDEGVELVGGHAVVDVKGVKRVEGVEVMRLTGGGDAVIGLSRSIDCDLVAISGGWNPAVHLHSQSGARACFSNEKSCFVPGSSVQVERSIGACSGSFRLGDCLAEGFAAGAEAAQATGFGGDAAVKLPLTSDVDEEDLRTMWLVPSREPFGRGPKQFVDLQNDTTTADIKLASLEGYHSVEHVKRYTALGFGTDQGKLGNINGAAILASTLGTEISKTGTTTFRPAYTPVSFGAIAGRDVKALYEPVRKTALHEWHETANAEFENVGQWKRPWYYPQRGESMQEAVNRECLAVRSGVGLLDASTLGKIDVQGPDAAEFLDRVYTNDWKKLAVGRCRYGLMLGEDGMVMDDGVGSRLGEQHFVITTTTGGAAHVLAWLERWLQTEWPNLKVHLTSVTEHWATLSIAGPKSRALIAELCGDIDFSHKAFPFMSYREGTVADVGARVFRISFTGELSYEINVPANYARHVWEQLMVAGIKYGITPYGTEVMHVLRAEKGFIIVGQDTDGSVTPLDLGMQWIVSKNKDFIGKRSLSRADCTREDRKQLVGLATDSPNDVLPEGAQLVDDPYLKIPMPMIGHVSSSYFSACLGRSVALALVKGGRARTGETVFAPLAGGKVLSATIVSPVFYDAEGAKQNV